MSNSHFWSALSQARIINGKCTNLDCRDEFLRQHATTGPLRIQGTENNRSARAEAALKSEFKQLASAPQYRIDAYRRLSASYRLKVRTLSSGVVETVLAPGSVYCRSSLTLSDFMDVD